MVVPLWEGRLRQPRLWRVGAVVMAVWLAFMVVSASRAVAEAGQQVGDALAVTLDGTFAPAAVGRLPGLAGPGFAAPAIQAAFYGRVSTGSVVYVPASPVDELLLLSVATYTCAPPLGSSDLTYKAGLTPALSVDFAGSTVALPQSPRGAIDGVAGSGYGQAGELHSGEWLVAVPKGATVSLSAAEEGFTDSADVRDATRVGEAPSVLYRSAAGPLALDVRSNLAGSLVVEAGGERVSFPVTLKEAFLRFFDLSSANDMPASTAGMAYLFAEVFIGTGVDSQGRPDWYFDPSSPGQAVTVTAAGGTPETAVRVPAAPGPVGVRANGVASGGLFGFVVPAGLTAATVTVGTGPDPAVYYQGPNDFAATVETVTSSTPAAFKINSPPASPAPAVSKPPTLASSSLASSPATTVSNGAATPSTAQGGPPTVVSRRHGGQGWWPIVVAVSAGVVVIATVGLLVARRARITGSESPSAGEQAPPRAADVGVDGASSNSDSRDSVGGAGGVPGAAAEPVGTGAAGLPCLRVGVLGPLVVEGAGEIRRKVVLRALIVLAVFAGRPVGSEELRGWLADDEYSEPTAATLRSEISRLRRLLPDGLLPEMGAASGYALAAEGVEVDWVNFEALAAQADKATGHHRIELNLEALRLIRGRVLEHRSWHGIDGKVWEMNASI